MKKSYWPLYYLGNTPRQIFGLKYFSFNGFSITNNEAVLLI